MHSNSRNVGSVARDSGLLTRPEGPLRSLAEPTGRMGRWTNVEDFHRPVVRRAARGWPPPGLRLAVTASGR